MYNACTVMYIHIRSQASDWNCCVKRLFVCAQQSTSLIVHIERDRVGERKRHRGGRKKERDRETEREKERERERERDFEGCNVGD